MSIFLLRPGVSFDLGGGRRALSEALAGAVEVDPGPSGFGGDLMMTSAIAGWWDASSLALVTGPDGATLSSWLGQVAAVTDRSGRGGHLIPYSAVPGIKYGVIKSHLSGVLGGIGRVSGGTSLSAPVLDPDFGFRTNSSVIFASASWTWYLVWSRPNWRQGPSIDQQPTTLLSQDGVPIIQVDGSAGAGRLVLCPGQNGVLLSGSIARRHTHSLIIRYETGRGLDVWLDDSEVASGVSVPLPSSAEDGTLLLHSGHPQGGAQCWFHEAACWSARLSDTQIGVVLAHASRWTRGQRKGVSILINGQSNAVNFALNDGAALLLAQGAAWCVGALSYGVIASTGLPLSYTMQSGHGIYQVGNGIYPGSFLLDPGDGSDPMTWGLGADGEALQRALSAIPIEDREDICAIVWPWSETDSLRSWNELERFTQAVRRLVQLERAMLGKTARQLPLVLWSAIPYGTPEGVTMHRMAVSLLAGDSSLKVVIGNRQTSDSNARGSVWNETTGLTTGGDFAHRDGADNRRFGTLAAVAVGHAIADGFEGDPIGLNSALALRGSGPTIIHAYLVSLTQILLTVRHDGGTDLVVQRQAANGRGFAVMDGGISDRSGVVIEAIACTRVDATHLLVTLPSAIQMPISQSGLFYPYGSTVIGRGNVVSDNYSEIAKPYWWNIGHHLGGEWNQNYPLAATLTHVPISSAPL